MPVTTDELSALIGRGELIDRDGQPLGRLGRVYLDDETGAPSWVTVEGPGGRGTFVPVEGARRDGDRLHLAYDRAVVDGAPAVDDDGSISAEEDDALVDYYGLRAGTAGAADLPSGGVRTGRPARAEVIRSEERMVTGTQVRATERVVLRKYVVTEEVTRTFTVRREEIRIEHVPVTDSGTEVLREDVFDESLHEIVLHAEVPVISTQVVPVERVRFGKRRVRGEQTVTAQLAHEEVQVDQARRPD